jgi:hypothetical protein
VGAWVFFGGKSLKTVFFDASIFKKALKQTRVSVERRDWKPRMDTNEREGESEPNAVFIRVYSCPFAVKSCSCSTCAGAKQLRAAPLTNL